jgi:biopolymer transport protein TolR
MVTAPLINPGSIDLPSVGTTGTLPVQPIEVQLAASGAISVIDHDVSGTGRRVSREELAGLIQAKQRQKPTQAVVISADKEIKYDAVMQTMDLLVRNRVESVGLLAIPSLYPNADPAPRTIPVRGGARVTETHFDVSSGA